METAIKFHENSSRTFTLRLKTQLQWHVSEARSHSGLREPLENYDTQSLSNSQEPENIKGFQLSDQIC